MVKIRLVMINNVNILYNLNSKLSRKFYQQFTEIKLKFREKVATSGFNYKEV